MILSELDFLRSLRNITNDFLDAIFEGITFIGEQYPLIVIILILYFAVNKEKTEKIIYSIFLCGLVNGAIKLLVCRPRPFMIDETLNIARGETATGYSFPSGHTQNTTTTYSGIAFSFKKKSIIIIACVIVCLVGFSRLWLGVHYPTDVLAGLLLGIACSFFGIFILNKFGTSFNRKSLIYLLTFIVFIPFAIVFFIRMENVENGYRLYKDFFVSMGMYLGGVGGLLLEQKFVNFSDTKSIKIKVLRVIGSFICFFAFYLIFSLIFKSIVKENVILDGIRYALVAFISLGVYPIVFKNILFKK